MFLDLSDRCQIFGTFFGQKKVRGKWTSRVCYSCLTENKKRGAAAFRDVERVPKRLLVDERRQVIIPTDVVEGQAKIALQNAVDAGQFIAGPGDRVVAGDEHASVGAAVLHPTFGKCVTTAGHLFTGPAAGATVSIVGSTGQGDAVVYSQQTNGTLDYALLGPTGSSVAENLFRGAVTVGPAYWPTLNDVGSTLSVLSGLEDPKPAVCRGVGCNIGNYEDLILTDVVTMPGDSGGVLVDTAARVWGFVIGVSGGFSIYMPIHLLIAAERCQLL